MAYMKFFVDGLTPELIEKAKLELGETDEVRTNALIELHKLINEEPEFFPCMEEIFLLAFLRTKKFNVPKAFKTLKNFYKFKERYSGSLTDFKPSDQKLCLGQGIFYNLEYRDKNNGSVGIIRIGLHDIYNFSVEQFIASTILFSLLSTQSEATQVAGHSVIVDLTELNWRIAKYYCSPSLYKMFDTIVNCLPMRVKGYHVINGSVYLDVLYSIFKRFMPEKFRTRLHFHSDYESLHKLITPDILPEEYGGMQGPMSIYGQEFMKFMLSQDDTFIEINKYGFKRKIVRYFNKIK